MEIMIIERTKGIMPSKVLGKRIFSQSLSLPFLSPRHWLALAPSFINALHIRGKTLSPI